MKLFLRYVFVFLAVSVAIATIPADGFAKSKKQSSHNSAHQPKSKKSTAATSSKAEIKKAQKHLIELGFLTGKADGIQGSKTKAALKKFQRANGLLPSGSLTRETIAALENAIIPLPSPQKSNRLSTPKSKSDFYALHPDYYGYVHQNYADAFQIGVPAVPSRFARVDVREADVISGVTNGHRRYDVAVNQAPLFSAEDQPAVIAISRTFSMMNEDAVIFTTYRPNNIECSYRHYLLVLNTNGTRLMEMDNCTFAHTANLVNDMLVVSFPEESAARAAASVWRYDHGQLTKL